MTAGDTRDRGGPLQEQLRDLAALAVVGDHVRWVLRGPGAPALAERLAEAAGAWRAEADAVARAMADAGIPPDARIRSLARDIPWNWVPDGWLDADAARGLIGDRLGRLADWTRSRLQEGADPAHGPLLERILARLEEGLADLAATGC
ncbi:MAG TPA: hypothetical protein VFH58_15425 [Acidimicrobiales bacterium]|nr:hypothetical protein [Acidimicrobiales bacterium]